MNNWVSCSDAAIERGDHLEGTGSRGLRWLAVELSGAWGHHALLDSPTTIEPTLGRAIVRRAEREGMRIVAIRKPGRRRAEKRWRWAVADARPGQESLRWGEVDDPHHLLAIHLDRSDGAESDDPLIAVCAHGKHDRCCAVRGRRAAAAIHAEFPEWTWECSHLGGDRFAATMIVLPHGLYYGRMDTDDPGRPVRLFREGRVEVARFRGRSSLPEVVQAAQHHARLRFGSNGIDDLVPLDVTPDGDETDVVLAGPHGPVVVRVAEYRSEPIFTMCLAHNAGPVRQFRLVSISAGQHP
ncbi:MAG TPA: sucrase ferredoxin [Aldersonia sp.]